MCEGRRGEFRGSFRSETSEWGGEGMEGLGGLARESVEQDASKLQRKENVFEQDKTVLVSSQDGTVRHGAKERVATVPLSGNFSKEDDTTGKARDTIF